MENEREYLEDKSEVEITLEVKKVLENASDMELALFLTGHIDNPCEAEVAPGKKENIREFYLKEAKGAILKMTNEYAKRFLELKIKEYEL